MRTSIVSGRVWRRHCVASTCSTSEVPIPSANAPKAPCVAVCESPQTMMLPGTVRPSSGPITCTMPWKRCPAPKQAMPLSSQLRRSASICALLMASAPETPSPVVGTLWSMVATT